MKHCPACNRTYTDDSLKFCLRDGALLKQDVDESSSSSSSDAHATLTLPAAETSEPPRSEQSADALVEFRQTSYTPPGGNAPIISELSFKVERGERLVLLGESGCGKTTTLKLVNRLLTPSTGKVLVEGKATTEWDVIRLRRMTGYVIQEGGLFPHFTVERNVSLVPRLEGWPETRSQERARELLSLVGLEPERFAARYPRELSGGQRQRVGVARALAADPPLLLMDEPFGALDPLTRQSIQREFKELSSRLKKTVILVTHDVREALLLGTRIGLMHAGRLLLLCTPQEFLQTEEEHARRYFDTLQLK